jgi:hypothetical protein
LYVLILTNVRLKHASVIIKYPQFFLKLLFAVYNPISSISSIEPLNGGNYSSWREKFEMALALSEIDLALTSPCPMKSVDLVRGENETDAAWTTRTCEHAPIIMKLLSPYFDRARSGPWSKMGLEGSRYKACKLGPVRKMEAIRPCKLGISS